MSEDETSSGQAFRLGLIVNPLAGIGGAVGLKGSDGAAIVAEARERGAEPRAHARAVRALRMLAPLAGRIRIHAGAGAMDADAAREAGFVNEVVAPGHTEAEARKVAREICALPAEAVAISRRLLKLPPEDLTRRIDQESHLFGERMRSEEAVAAFKAFFARKKG